MGCISYSTQYLARLAISQKSNTYFGTLPKKSRTVTYLLTNQALVSEPASKFSEYSGSTSAVVVVTVCVPRHTAATHVWPLMHTCNGGAKEIAMVVQNVDHRVNQRLLTRGLRRVKCGSGIVQS